MLTENGSGMVMPVGPMYGNGGSGAFGACCSFPCCW